MSDTHAQTVPFVRDTMLPEAEPPARERGIVKWMRENLFSGWLNILLTVLSIYVIWFVLSHILPWLLHSVWNAQSLNECRAIRNDRWGADASSACFAVLVERWNQLVFGFYPNNLYWRPVLAFLIFLGSICPVLFSSLPRKLLYLSAAGPFVIFLSLIHI